MNTTNYIQQIQHHIDRINEILYWHSVHQEVMADWTPPQNCSIWGQNNAFGSVAGVEDEEDTADSEASTTFLNEDVPE